MNEVIGTIAESYAEYRCDPSIVENTSSAGFYSKRRDDDTVVDDLDSMHNMAYVTYEYSTHIFKSTAV